MGKQRNLSIYLTAFLLLSGGVGFLAYTGLNENSVYFLNVSEARAATSDKLAQARLFGTVGAEGITRPSGGLGVSFQLEDKDRPVESIAIDYSGVVPDSFKPGAEVIVEGGIKPDGRFHAKTMMTKCPSKYQKENRKI